MLKSATHLGRLYFSFIPTKLVECSNIFNDFACANCFDALHDASGEPDESSLGKINHGIYLDRISEALPLANKSWRDLSISVPVDFTMLLHKRRWRIPDVLEINRRVMGLPVLPQMRKGGMWIGSHHPADACYVAPPAEDVATLMADLVEFCSCTHWPPLMKGVIAMQQLLLIHPFEDGNGRSARALMFCLADVEPVSIAVTFDVIEELWRFKQLRLLAVQQQIRNDNNWVPLLELLAECILRHVRNFDRDHN